MPQDQVDEGMMASMMRVCSNCCTECFGAVQTTDEYAKIKLKESQIRHRARQFGADYYKLLRNTAASDQAKQACINAVLADTDALEREIEALKSEIERVDQITKLKRVQKPAVPVAAATAAPTTTTPMTRADSTSNPPPTVRAYGISHVLAENPYSDEKC
jgi:hypothetical protein